MKRALALALALISGSVLTTALLPVSLVVSARAQDAAAITGPIAALYAGLEKIQQSGSGSTDQRAQVISPAIDSAFDLAVVLQASVGLRYNTLNDQEKQDLLQAFRQFTIARYISTFKPGSKVHFDVADATHPSPVGSDQIVTTHIGADGDPSPTEVDYVMRQGNTGWKIVDILLNAHISQAAAQRADFRATLDSGGVAGLISMLNQKAKTFMAG